MSVKDKIKRGIKYLLVIMLISAILGFILGGFEEEIASEIDLIMDGFLELFVQFGLLGVVILLLIVLNQFIGLRKKAKEFEREDIAEDKLNNFKKKLERTKFLNSITIIFYLLLITVSSDYKTYYHSIILILILVCAFIIEKSITNYSNLFRFNEEISYWDNGEELFEKMDDGEKWLIGNASYKALNFGDKLMVVFWIMSTFISDLLSIPNISAIFIILFWGIQKILYLYQAKKYDFF